MFHSRLAVVSALLMFATACGSSSPPTSPSPTPTAAPTPGGPLSSITIPMRAEALGNRAYIPDDLNVSVGSTVTWVNTDSVSHTSTSDVSGWDSGIVTPRGQFSFGFQSAGTYRYHCAIHPGMVGTIVVR
jgi:plastocyanin